MKTVSDVAVPSAAAASDASGRTGHPRGLSTLFFTEMWERFSYYGMRALLVLYMTAPLAAGGLGFDTPKATSIYGIYTSSVYLTSLLGGFLADKIFGSRLAVLIGGIIIACGHFSMAFPSLFTFYGGLCLIAAGTGLLKPNVSVMVGDLYAGDDARRDAGYSIFYMGINLGAFIAPLICGYLGQRVNWHYGFAAAGVGMVLGLVQYVFSGDRLKGIGDRPAKREPNVRPDEVALTTDKPMPDAQPSRPAFTTADKKRLAVLGILFVFASLFWMAFEQAGSSLSLFADRLTRNSIFGWEFPSSWFQSVNSIFIIALAPVFSWLWLRLGSGQPSSVAKFAYGLLFAGLGFLVVAYASSLTGAGRVSPIWLILVFLFHTIGELCLSPVGLSTFSKLAPARIVGLMMGVWFLSLSIGNFAAGRVAGLFDENAEGALVRLFGSVAVVTIVAAVLLAALTPLIKRLTPRAP
ncbi:MAG: peptide MFS transporter [Pyrinomonadaceae bacterium]